MSNQLIRFLDTNNEVKVGIRSADSNIASLVPTESMASLLALSLSELLSVVETALASGATSEIHYLLPPVDQLTEVWAAGVTYKRSRAAREEESDHSDVYSRVYDAARPELFFKSVAWRVVGHGEPIGVRADSTINAPEPELALVTNAAGEIVGVTICDDVSSRNIEGENPLYLPQAKVYLGSAAVGPGIVPIWEIEDIYALDISVKVERAGEIIWGGTTSTHEMHRKFEELVDYLFMNMSFPQGAILSTGTGLAPNMDFNLSPGDVVVVEIASIGSLENKVISASQENFGWLTNNLTRRAH